MSTKIGLKYSLTMILDQWGESGNCTKIWFVNVFHLLSLPKIFHILCVVVLPSLVPVSLLILRWTLAIVCTILTAVGLTQHVLGYIMRPSTSTWLTLTWLTSPSGYLSTAPRYSVIALPTFLSMFRMNSKCHLCYQMSGLIWLSKCITMMMLSFKNTTSKNQCFSYIVMRLIVVSLPKCMIHNLFVMEVVNMAFFVMR